MPRTASRFSGFTDLHALVLHRAVSEILYPRRSGHPLDEIKDALKKTQGQRTRAPSRRVRRQATPSSEALRPRSTKEWSAVFRDTRPIVNEMLSITGTLRRRNSRWPRNLDSSRSQQRSLRRRAAQLGTNVEVITGKRLLARVAAFQLLDWYLGLELVDERKRKRVWSPGLRGWLPPDFALPDPAAEAAFKRLGLPSMARYCFRWEWFTPAAMQSMRSS